MSVTSITGRLVILLSLVSLSVEGAEPYFVANYCVERTSPQMRSSNSCPGYTIPAHQTRNFQYEELRCASNENNHTRSPVQFDEEAWLDLKNVSRDDAASILRKQPAPAWSGSIPYQTFVHWEWEDCQLITSSRVCGTYEVCEERDVSNYNGEPRRTRKCHQEPKSCYSNVTVHESEQCPNGHGQLDFDVEFLKKSASDWHPGNPDYIDRLANGYDLLPGEEEVVTVSNLKTNWWKHQSTTLSPTLVIQDPKNEYTLNQFVHRPDAQSLSCRFQGYDKVSFTVDTQQRIASRSPNGFSLPESFDNETIDPLVWQSAPGSNGTREEKGFPMIMRAQDYSAAAINEVSEEVSEKFKNILIRVQLYEPSLFGERLKSTIYIDEAKGVQQTLNAISSDQKIRRSTLWEFKLKNGDDPNKNIYRSYVPSLFYYPGKIFLSNEALSYDDHLAPDTEYTLKLTVYQKNLPFYHQSCESEPDAWDCKWYALWGLFSPKRYEDNYFSKKSLDLKFHTNPNVDMRTWLSTFWHFTSYAQFTIPVGTIAYSLYYFL